MNIEEKLVDYDTAVMLKDLGHHEGADYYAVRHAEDYTYDGDPTHPESHKRGEVSIYRGYDDNRHDSNCVSLPAWHDVEDWLREKHGIHIATAMSHTPGLRWSWAIFDIATGDVVDDCGSTEYDEYPKALSGGIKRAVKLLNTTNFINQ